MHDVVIIGAGWAGISAAMELERRSPPIDCVVLEASPCIGGRALSVARDDGGSNVVDLGAHYFGAMHTRLFAIAKTLAGTEIYDRVSVYGDDPGFRAFLDGSWIVTTRKNSFFELQGLSKNVPLAEGLRVVRSALVGLGIEHVIDAAAPWHTPFARWLDALTLHDWIEAQDIPQSLRDMWNLAAIGIQSADPKRISLLYFFWYHATSGGFMVTANDWEGSPQQYSVRCGLGNLLARYAAELSAPILVNSPVSRIVSEEGCQRVECADGRVLRARHVIVAGSPHAVGRSIDFVPEVSSERRTILDQRAGHAAKAVFVYDDPFWRASHGTHFYGYFGGVRTDGLEWALDTSDPDADEYSLMFFVSPSLAARIESVADEGARRTILAEAVVEVTGDPRAASFRRVDTFRWQTREYVWGGPNTTFAPGVLSRVGDVFHAPEGPEGRVHFASAESSTEFTGYVEGAIRSGESVAARVHFRLHADDAGAPPERAPSKPMRDPRRFRRTKSAALFFGAATLSVPIAMLDRVHGARARASTWLARLARP